MEDRPKTPATPQDGAAAQTAQEGPAAAADVAESSQDQSAAETVEVTAPPATDAAENAAAEPEAAAEPGQAAAAEPEATAEPGQAAAAPVQADDGQTEEGQAAPVEAAEAEANAGEDFAALIDDKGQKTPQAPADGGSLNVGDKVSGVIVKIGKDSSFVDFGGRSEGHIKTVELLDGDGKPLFGVGDPIEAFAAAVGDEVQLTRSIGSQNREADALYRAFKSGIPVDGKVTAVNKWGLGVEVQGMRAFCPVSQVDVKYVESTDEYRDKTLQFKIIRFRDQGRTIVLSRRALIEGEQKQEADEVRATLKKGARVSGRVTRLEDFGAFVDLGGGVEGLVHVSELKHERVGHPKEVLEEGQEIEVGVLGVKNPGVQRKERISLSLKALEKDPWQEATSGLKPGTIVDGKVDAIEDYGAFIELAPNVRGMVHVSELADRRVAHPRDVLSVGDEVKVVVLDLDDRKRRLRLSVRRVESMESDRNLKEFNERRKKEDAQGQGSNSMLDALRRAQLID